MSEEIIEGGYIYVLYNPIYEKYGEIYKIGQTKDIKDRLYDYSTYYPEESEILYSIKHPYYKDLEKVVHLKLKDYRVKDKREFFKCKLDLIKTIMIKVKKYTLKDISELLNKNTDTIENRCETFTLKEPLNLTKERIFKIYSDLSNELSNNFFLNNKHLGLRAIIKIFIEKICSDENGKNLIVKYKNKYRYTNMDNELAEITAKGMIELILNSFNFKNVLSYNCSLSLSIGEINHETYKERIKYIDKELRGAQTKISKILSEYIY
jgi:hypothetical protein